MYYSTADEMEKLDRLAVETGLNILQMMELAGWHMTSVFGELEIEKSKKITVVAGKGNKGGDGFAAARHLINHGYDVSIVLASGDLKSDPQHHLDLLDEMDTTVLLYSQAPDMSKEKIENSDVVIDSLIGYHLDGAPKNEFKDLVNIINDSESVVISYDLPTGLNPTTGHCFSPCIQADATLTLALPKRGLKEATQKVGRLFLGDIGIPDMLYNKIKPGSRPDFSTQGLIEL
ncbi:MAG: NAD(P)H-hydrate epimerase [Candidatus Magasanikbacteria bacterium]